MMMKKQVALYLSVNKSSSEKHDDEKDRSKTEFKSWMPVDFHIEPLEYFKKYPITKDIKIWQKYNETLFLHGTIIEVEMWNIFVAAVRSNFPVNETD